MDDVIQKQEQHNPGGEKPHQKKPLTSKLLARDSKAVTSVLQAVAGAQSRKVPSMPDDEEAPPLVPPPPTHHSNVQIYDTKPIADLFPSATVIFGDLVGFTAWSSVREPTEVFMLLETLYNAFDQAARKGGIFKVETIGDCYSTFS
jgi:class 3 adenylate cyclase